MISNLYWPVYTNLERNVDELAFAIHIDDAQLPVYSSRITDLILRAAAEIESLSKELYKKNGGTDTGNLKFDDVALKYLEDLWLLERKEVVISSPHCFQTNRILTPFVKNEIRTASMTAKRPNGRLTYSWNNAYQNLKHDRAQSITFGSVKYLFDILAALYLLNIYYKGETIPLGKDATGVNFPLNLGSSLFSVRLDPTPSTTLKGKYIPSNEFASAAYYIDLTVDTRQVVQQSLEAFDSHFIDLATKHPKFIEYINTNDVSSSQDGNLLLTVLGKELHLEIMKQSMRDVPIKVDQLEYEAMLNIKML